jgi:MFS family permease
MSAVFSLSQCLTGIAWGRASDKVGWKPMIVLALTCKMASSVLFGFSRSLVWVFIARSLQGLSNRGVGIIRTAVAEMVSEKELQPRAFSLMPLIWTVGGIFGPGFEGSLVHPVERFPGLSESSKLLKEYPFALPNILISVLFIQGISQGTLFLKETLEEKKHRRDYGVIFGSLLTRSCRRKKPAIRRQDTEEEAPFLTGNSSEIWRNIHCRVDIGYVIISWWFLADIAIVGAIPVWQLIEMEGFSSSDDSDDSFDKE